MTLHLGIQFIILLALLLLSAFFSSAETALTTVSKIKIRTMADDGDLPSQTVLKILGNQSKMLSAILIGNNVVNLSASSLATSIAIDLWGSFGAGIATGILTFLILIFGEIAPKTMATVRSVRLSRKYASLIWGLMVVLTPLIFVINFLASSFLRLFGISGEVSEDAITEDDLKTIVDVSQESGVIETDEHTYIHNVFDFSDATAKEIMIPRIDMTVVDVTDSYEHLMELFAKEMFTRIPVYENETDNIIGIINMKDLLLLPSKEGFSIRDHIREAYFTYEQKNTADLFDEMRSNSVSLAIVVDEYGALAGMITLEDLLEELVGEIRDEYDEGEEDEFVEINPREYDVLGSMNLEDLCKLLPLGFTSEDYDTIGGYLTGAFDHFPRVGETYLTEDGILLQVSATQKKRIRRVHIKLPAETE